MRNRLFLTVLLAGLLLWMLPLSASASSAEMLTSAELLSWREALEETLPALSSQTPTGVYDEESEAWSFAYDFGFVTSDDETLVSGVVSRVEITSPSLACPRGIRVGDSPETVLAAYACEASSLPEEGACLTLYTDAASLGWGWILRQSDAVFCVQFAAPIAAEGMEGYAWDLNIRYILSDGLVSSILIDGFSQGISQAECRANFSAAQEAARQSADVSCEDQELSAGPVFQAEDLQFSGLDFGQLDLDALISILGSPLQTEDDAQGVKTCLFEDVLAECQLEDDVWRVNALMVTGSSLSGPRGVIPGLPASSVLSAFGGYALPQENTLLYEDLVSGVWGQYIQEDGQSSVTYGITLDTQRYVLTISFADGVITEYLIYHE